MRRTGPHISRVRRRQPGVAPPDPALALSERRYRELADALPQSVFETDERGVLTFANRAAFETFGYGEDELARGPSVLQMLAPDERERAAANVRARMAGERTGPAEYQMQRGDGTVFPAIVYADLIERDGRITGMRGIVADISARKAADERLRLTNARLELLNSTSQALNAGAPLSDAVQGSCDGLRELFGYDYVELFLPAVDSEHLSAHADRGGFGLRGPLVGHSRLSRTFADARLVEFRGRDEILPLIVDLAPPDEREMLDLAPRIYEILGVQYVCQIPLLCAGEVVGHLAVGRRDDASLPDREKRFLEQFSEQLAVIIAKARTEDRLRSSEQRYRALFNSGNDAVLLHDLPGSETPGRIMAVNDLSCEMSGYSRDELLGMTIWDVQPPTLEVDLSEIERRLREDGRALFETACLTRDGRLIPVEVNTHLFELDGRPVALSVARDITERKRWEERLRRVNECFLSFGPDPHENIASLTNLCGEVLAADWTVYARRQGTTMIPVAGWHVPEGLVPPEDISGCICEDVVGAADDRVVALSNLQESRYAARDPNVRNFGARSYLGRAVRLHDGTDGSVCAFFARDYVVTEADEQMMGIIAAAIGVEEERRQVRDQRERALADLKVLNRDLERARQEAEDANRLKSEFLANTSHEIRTPLNGIVGYLQLVLNGLTDSPEEEREFLTGAADSARHLLSLINDVLDVAKIEAGKLRIDPEPVNVAAALAELHSLVRVQADQGGIALVFRPVHEGLTAWCDPERLKQVLLNLLGNAVKFTPAGGSITVSAATRDDEGAVLFEVTDTGIGIPRDKLDAIFEKFVQADGSTTRARGGSGLGLTISRRLVELMGGTMTAHSDGAGTGSTFRFTVPVHRDGPRAGWQGPEQFPDAHGDPSRPLVLVVEDDPLYRDYLCGMLDKHGWATMWAATADDAVAAIDRHVPAAITIDYSLPTREGALLNTGWDLLVALQTDARLVRTAIVLVTGDTEALGRRLSLDELPAGVEVLDKRDVQTRLVEAIDRVVAAGEPDRPAHILLVDDDRRFAAVLERLLGERGHALRVVGDGEAAVAHVRDHGDAVDLLLLDLRMPGVSGYEVLRRIRLTERGADLPVLVVTAYPEPPTLDQSMLLAGGGLVRLLTKQDVLADPDRLCGVIEQFLHAHPAADADRPSRANAPDGVHP